MRIKEIINESMELNESVVLTEGAKDIFKKLMLGATLAAAAAGASAQDTSSLLSSVKNNPELAQRLSASNPEAMKQIATMDTKADQEYEPPYRQPWKIFKNRAERDAALSKSYSDDND